jgi:predicted nucleic acid-binding protein
LTQGAVSAAYALTVLTELTGQKGHEFWPLGQNLMPRLETLAPRLRGHGQWTDALLLVQAVEKGGVLVTFDSGFKELVPGDMRGHLLVLKRS